MSSVQPRQISAIYEQYQVMPNLALHQLRVAAVAQTIIDSFTLPINGEAVITACLLHDMGNILKFDFKRFPDFLEPLGLEYWVGVQKSFLERYGEDEHSATLAIARELQVSETVLALIEAVGFSHAPANARSPQFEQKIAAYSDMRVAPHGVVALSERVADLTERYAQHYPTLADQKRREYHFDCLQEIEDQVFAHTSLLPHLITEHSVSDRIGTLRSWHIAEPMWRNW